MQGASRYMSKTLIHVGVLTGLSWAIAIPCAAQISTLFLDPWDIDYSYSRSSARLGALGNAWVAIEDESNEINLWDYGNNVAGFLDDRDAWSGDFWASSVTRDRSPVEVKGSGAGTETGFQLSFRNWQRALGVEGSFTSAAVEDGLDRPGRLRGGQQPGRSIQRPGHLQG